MIWRRHASLALGCLTLLAGCGATDLEARRALAGNLAAGRGWQLETIAVPPFRLATWHGPMRGPVLTVYLEGDGFAWATPSRPSFNPTPGDPVGLKLALAHDDGSATSDDDIRHVADVLEAISSCFIQVA